MRSSDLSIPHVKPTHPPPLIRLPFQRLSHDPRILVSLRVHIAIPQFSSKALFNSSTPSCSFCVVITPTFSRGDGDLLVWTGEKVGVITTQKLHDGVDELNRAFDETLGNGDVDTKADEYARVMRQALERQADEKGGGMSRFNMRYR